MADTELVPITREFLANFYKEHEIGPVSEDVVRLINTLEVKINFASAREFSSKH